MNEKMLEKLNDIAPDIRQLRQVFISKDIGTLKEITVQIVGIEEPVRIKIVP